MNRAETLHQRVIELSPMYKETAHWTPVSCDSRGADTAVECFAWAEKRGLKRGDTTSRNDFLVPLNGLWLFKDPKVAMEFKMLWG